MAPEFLLGPPTSAQLARSGGYSFLDFEDAIDVVGSPRAAGKVGPQHPAVQQGKTVGRTELSHLSEDRNSPWHNFSLRTST